MAGLPAYKAGQPAPPGSYKISSNENPFPPLASVRKVLEDAAGGVNRYPDPASSALLHALSARFERPADCFAVGTGSVGILQQAMQSVLDAGEEVVFAWRSFEAYPIIAQIVGATQVRVPLRPDETHDLPAMAAAVTERTRLVIVCTPNNPTSTSVRREELDEFLEAVPRDVLVVLDEAYREFVRDPDAPDGLRVQAEHPNVAVLRTFSKAYGLAGLRVGFAVAHSEVAEALRKTAVPFGVSSLAEDAAVASLAAEAELLERVEVLVAERARVLGALRAQGWQVARSEANFVWLRTGEHTAEVAAACAAAGVVVRPFDGEGVRVTVAEPAASDRFLAAVAAFARTR
ncbi:MAG TPA: histidinol-phosphate transaminase [Actinomycetes bacterium]|nr:histidinol-phosphate transaminase [Actinomycetes bacterium]